MSVPRDITCRACLERLPDVLRYQVGKPIVITRVLASRGHAMFRHPNGAISLCLAHPKRAD